MGTVKSMGGGCTCPAHSVVKALLRHLVVERDEIVILDMEAGIEHLGRGTAEHVDILLVVSDANKKSLDVAATICRLARESDIPRIGLVGNRVSDSRHATVIRDFAGKHDLPVIALIPFDQTVADAGISGEPVEPSTSVALQAIGDLARNLEGNLNE